MHGWGANSAKAAVRLCVVYTGRRLRRVTDRDTERRDAVGQVSSALCIRLHPALLNACTLHGSAKHSSLQSFSDFFHVCWPTRGHQQQGGTPGRWQPPNTENSRHVSEVRLCSVVGLVAPSLSLLSHGGLLSLLRDTPTQALGESFHLPQGLEAATLSVPCPGYASPKEIAGRVETPPSVSMPTVSLQVLPVFFCPSWAPQGQPWRLGIDRLLEFTHHDLKHFVFMLSTWSQAPFFYCPM